MQKYRQVVLLRMSMNNRRIWKGRHVFLFFFRDSQRIVVYLGVSGRGKYRIDASPEACPLVAGVISA
jgi:hypothetical protein